MLGALTATMSDPFRMYETARKSMYSAMEQEADPPRARQGYKEAVDGFDQFLTAAAKNRGMYRELVGTPAPFASSFLPFPCFDCSFTAYCYL